jgi:hypothetical protein
MNRCLCLTTTRPHTHRLADQRYEPLPSIDRLPAWLWRRTGARTRVALGLALLAAIALTAVLVPAIQRDKQARAAAAERVQTARHRATIKALQREQRPRFGRSQAKARPEMLRDLETAILADARTRGLDGPILRARCEPFPKTVGKPPEKPSGSYSCLAVTSEIDRSAATVGGELGHPYRAGVDFTTGRFALCKVAGRPDPIPDPEVTTPRVCAGGRLPAR